MEGRAVRGFVDHLVAQLLAVQINLYACRARLEARTDAEALHDLRIAVRKLRSLLRPLRGLVDFIALEQTARTLGQLSGPLRDAEVLLVQLQACAAQRPQQARQQQLDVGYGQLLASPELQALFAALDASVAVCRHAQACGALRGAVKHTAKGLAKNRKRLQRALNEPGTDRHRLRLLIKRLRYSAQAYPRCKLLSKPQMRALSAAQSALGDWHDHLQWLAGAQQQSDLQPLVSAWQAALVQAEQQSEQKLRTLQRLLHGSRS
ncbi:MAG: CHAD domain-containing protein [Pseudomonas sp.]|uniref:CHAD domain-containing protein n=1 Tax=Pseudomonas sp. TaxID=306 RepID=UPI0027342095|nr:CHAD domain-containing protein [Pseudomonas sp.]MDP3847900.1 CHAD domain-containing protein [Pseudomonas sp.]